MPDAIFSSRIVAALERQVGLTDDDREAIAGLKADRRELAAGTYLVREGQEPRRCAFLLDGFTFRQKLGADGARAIVGLQVPGDFVDLQNLVIRVSDHDVVALTPVIVMDIAMDELIAVAASSGRINRALWLVGLIEASIFREWLLNVGRRSAHARLAHLLCEFSTRLAATGVARELTYELPMTQEQLGDAMGLTSVHVNRVLKGLEQEGLIRRRKREVSIVDWQRLRRAADFNERYLHLKTG